LPDTDDINKRCFLTSGHYFSTYMVTQHYKDICRSWNTHWLAACSPQAESPCSKAKKPIKYCSLVNFIKFTLPKLIFQAVWYWHSDFVYFSKCDVKIRTNISSRFIEAEVKFCTFKVLYLSILCLEMWVGFKCHMTLKGYVIFI
jgi:hypothetical protein